MNDPNNKLCPKFKAYFVTGIRSVSGNSKKYIEVTKAYNCIQSWLGISVDRFIEICTNFIYIGSRTYNLLKGAPSALCQFAEYTTQHTVARIVQELLRQGAECKCGQITSVFFAHSIGSIALNSAIREMMDNLEVDGKLMLGQMAVFNIGGVSIIHSKAAKVVANLRYTNDSFISLYRRVVGPSRDENCYVLLGPFLRHENGAFECMCCEVKENDEEGVSVLAERSTDNTGSFDFSTLKNFFNFNAEAHTLSDYVCCETLRAEVKGCLGLL